jgi:hypothetical protein
MFEDSLVESRIGYFSASNRWTALASISLQLAVAAIVIALPLLYPEALSFYPDTPKVMLPLSPKAPVTIRRVERASAASTGIAATSVVRAVTLPSLLPSRITAVTEALRSHPSASGGECMQIYLPALLLAKQARDATSQWPRHELQPALSTSRPESCKAC